MKYFDATQAKKLVKQYNINKKDNSHLNYQRSFILDRIKWASEDGKNYLVINYDHIILYEDDYKFFESLGYKVKREMREEKLFIPFGSAIEKAERRCHTIFGMLSW